MTIYWAYLHAYEWPKLDFEVCGGRGTYIRAIIRDLKLRRPIYRQTAAYGHFGRDDIDLPWEKTDRADALRRAAGL